MNAPKGRGTDGAGDGESIVAARVVVANSVGLHARPAVKLTKLAKQFHAEIRVRPESEAGWISAKSVNAVMRMKLKGGEAILLEASGSDACAAIGALVGLVERNFDE